MKSIVDYILERQITDDTKITAWDANTDFLEYLADQLGLDKKLFSISSEGVRYKKMLIPDTKLGNKPTVKDLMEKVLTFVENNDKAAAKTGKIKKLRKNFGVPRGSYGAKERMDARAKDRNNRIIHGQPLDDAEIYRG